MTSALDLDTAARTVFGEARGEPYEGQKAVAHVLWNRLATERWGTNLSRVCQAPKQFSCWNEGDPNRDKLNSVDYDDPVLRRALRAVLDARDEDDLTQGSTHYYAATRAEVPDWAANRTPVLTIGAHFFLNDVR